MVNLQSRLSADFITGFYYGILLKNEEYKSLINTNITFLNGYDDGPSSSLFFFFLVDISF